MKMTKTVKRLERFIQQFEDAAIEKSWIGTMHPAEHHGINLRYKHAKEELIRFMLSRLAEPTLEKMQ